MLTEQDQKKRSKGIGSSEIAMLIYLEDENGDMKPLSPWGGKHKLWRRKTGREGEQIAKSYMNRGTFMETGLINWYAHDNGVDWLKPKTVRSSEFPYVVDSCDGLTFPKGKKGKVEPLRCIEAKMTGAFHTDGWGAQGTDEIPNFYLVQCQWHLGVHRPAEMICDVPRDDGSRRLDYHVAFDEELWGSLTMEAERFWQDHVEKDVEPPVDDYADTNSWLSRYLKHRNGMGVLEADKEQIRLMLRYRDIALQLKDGEKALEEIKHSLINAIGDYDGILVPGTKQKILFKPSKDTMGVDWKSVAERFALKLISDGALSAAEVEEIKLKHTMVTRKGSRRWLPTSLIKNEGAKEE